MIILDQWNDATSGKRPPGRVLVSYDTVTKAEAKLTEAIYGERPSSNWRVTVARWDRGRWRDDRGQIIENVTHWMAMPEPKEYSR